MRPAQQAALIFWLFALPAAALAQADEQSPICTDRPAKANATCTVPDGKWQLESSVASWSLTKVDNIRTKVSQVGGSAIKLGLTDRSDLQVVIAPYVAAATKAGGTSNRVSGAGDVTVRYKHRLTGDSAPVQVALIPFVKLPTAKRGIGNRRVEGGLAVPVSIAISPVTVVLAPNSTFLPIATARGGTSNGPMWSTCRHRLRRA